MIMLMRAATAAAALLALALPTPALAHAADTPARRVPQTLPLTWPSTPFPLAAEDRTGYQRTSFKHWNASDIPTDGCNTCNEVLPTSGLAAPLRAAPGGPTTTTAPSPAPPASTSTSSSPRRSPGLQVAVISTSTTHASVASRSET